MFKFRSTLDDKAWKRVGVVCSRRVSGRRGDSFGADGMQTIFGRAMLLTLHGEMQLNLANCASFSIAFIRQKSNGSNPTRKYLRQFKHNHMNMHTHIIFQSYFLEREKSGFLVEWRRRKNNHIKPPAYKLKVTISAPKLANTFLHFILFSVSHIFS